MVITDFVRPDVMQLASPSLPFSLPLSALRLYACNRCAPLCQIYTCYGGFPGLYASPLRRPMQRNHPQQPWVFIAISFDLLKSRRVRKMPINDLRTQRVTRNAGARTQETELRVRMQYVKSSFGKGQAASNLAVVAYSWSPFHILLLLECPDREAPPPFQINELFTQRHKIPALPLQLLQKIRMGFESECGYASHHLTP